MSVQAAQPAQVRLQHLVEELCDTPEYKILHYRHKSLFALQG